MPQELYSVEQVAEILGLHVKTVRGYVREGRLKAVRIGKQYRIAAEDLAAMTGRTVASLRPEPARRRLLGPRGLLEPGSAGDAEGDSADSRTISGQSVESLRAMCMSLLLVLALAALVRARWILRGPPGLVWPRRYREYTRATRGGGSPRERHMTIDSVSAARSAGGEDVVDESIGPAAVGVVEMRGDPVAAVRRIYAHFGWSLSEKIEQRMRRVLASQPLEEYKLHRYNLSQFGVHEAESAARFAAYCDRFGLAASIEGTSGARAQKLVRG